MDHREGADKTGDVRLDFDRRVRLEFHGSKISSNGGLLLFRELDEVLGLHDIAGGLLRDTRTGHNRLHSLVGLLRQSVFGRLAGYDDVNDADRLSLDPVMRQVVGGRAVDAKAASSSQMGRFETEVLATSDNRTALADLSGQWIDRIHERKPPKWITLDMDSSVSPTHGAQEDTAWNGHFGCMCYHPLFVFNQFGHLERCALRPGNVHSADGWKDVLKSVMARYADRHLMRFFRGDAAFAIPDLYEMLEAESYFYAIRLRTNRVLQGKIAHLLKRPVGRPPNHVRRTYGDFQYQAASWDKPRRVIAKVEWHPGELFPRVGFVVTNMPMEADWIIQFYNQRGTAEQHIKEGKQAINWTRLSCKGMAQNEVRLQLHALAYNLGVLLRGTDLPEEIADWSLTSLQTRSPQPRKTLEARKTKEIRLSDRTLTVCMSLYVIVCHLSCIIVVQWRRHGCRWCNIVKKESFMHSNKSVATFAAVLGVLFLSACGGGGGGSGSGLSDEELDRVQSDPRVVRLGGILERADTLLVPSIRVNYSLSAQGQTLSDRLVERFSCSGARCVGREGTVVTVADLLDPDTDIDLTEVTLGSRGGFDTVVAAGKFDTSSGVQGVTITDLPSAFSYGFWGEYGFATVEIGDGPLAGRSQGVGFTGDISWAGAYVVGDASRTNPTGIGSAIWNGIAEAASTRTFQRRQGTATVTIADLSRPRVGVDIDIDDFAIGSSAWSGMALANGGFATGTLGTDRLEGNFYGPSHEETYGTFDTGAYVGAFGAKRDVP